MDCLRANSSGGTAKPFSTPGHSTSTSRTLRKSWFNSTRRVALIPGIRASLELIKMVLCVFDDLGEFVAWGTILKQKTCHQLIDFFEIQVVKERIKIFDQRLR